MPSMRLPAAWAFGVFLAAGQALGDEQGHEHHPHEHPHRKRGALHGPLAARHFMRGKALAGDTAVKGIQGFSMADMYMEQRRYLERIQTTCAASYEALCAHVPDDEPELPSWGVGLGLGMFHLPSRMELRRHGLGFGSRKADQCMTENLWLCQPECREAIEGMRRWEESGQPSHVKTRPTHVDEGHVDVMPVAWSDAMPQQDSSKDAARPIIVGPTPPTSGSDGMSPQVMDQLSVGVPLPLIDLITAESFPPHEPVVMRPDMPGPKPHMPPVHPRGVATVRPPPPPQQLLQEEDGDFDDVDGPPAPPAGAFIVMVLLWLAFAALIIKGFIQQEKRRAALLKIWRTIDTNPELKRAVEQAAGGVELPKPPKKSCVRKFCRAALVTLVVVLSLHMLLLLSVSPPPVLEPTDGSSSDIDYDDPPKSWVVLQLILGFMLLTSLIVVALKGIHALCCTLRGRQSSSASRATAPSVYPGPSTSTRTHQNQMYEPLATSEHEPVTEYVALPSPPRPPVTTTQVYVGVPVSAPPAPFAAVV